MSANCGRQPSSAAAAVGRRLKNFALVLILLAAAASSSFAFQTCPSICTCKWKNGKRYVECRGQGQITLPEQIDSETQVLDLSNNNLQILPREVFARHGLLNLQRLHLAKCNIGQIDPSAFRGLTNLVELNLAGNLLTAVPTATFADIPYLRELHLNDNPLQKIEASAFEMVPQLVTLDLSHCDIKRIAAKAFAELQQLQKLSLNNNKLTELRQKVVETIQGVHGVELSSNPWNCDCQLRPLKNWLLTFNVPYTTEPKCSSPARIAGKTFGELSVDEFACAPEIIAMPRHLEANAGQNASVICKVGSVPSSRIKWYIEGKSNSEVLNNSLVNRGIQRFLIFESGNLEKTSQLVLTNVREEDSGNYMCVAENQAGKVEANFTLQVGYFVGGVASLESSQIAGIAVSFTFIAIVLLILTLVFLVRNRLCGRGSPNGSSRIGGQTLNSESFNGEGDEANKHKQKDMEMNGFHESKPQNFGSGEYGSNGTIVINGTTYSMPKYNNVDLREQSGEQINAGLQQLCDNEDWAAAVQQQSGSPIVTHRDLIDRCGGLVGRSTLQQQQGGFYSPQLASRCPPPWRVSSSSSNGSPIFREYPADFGLPVMHHPNVSVNPLEQLLEESDVRHRLPPKPPPRLPSYSETVAPSNLLSNEYLNRLTTAVALPAAATVGTPEKRQNATAAWLVKQQQLQQSPLRESPDEGIQDDCSTDV